MPSTTNQNVATDKRVSKLVSKAYRALCKAEETMLELSGGKQGFTPAEYQAFESIQGAKIHLHSGDSWTPFEVG